MKDNRTKLSSTLILICLIGQVSVQAQKGVNTFTTQYTVSFTTGNTNDFIGKPSLRGFMFDYRYHLKPKVAIGMSMGWLTFFERKNYDTYTTSDETTSYSGKQYRYINSVPIIVYGDYYLTPSRTYSPFVGAGIGTTYNRFNNRIALYDIESVTWHFTIAPEAGFRFGYDFGISGYISTRYNHNFTTDDLDNQSYLSLNIGLMYR